MILAFLAPGRGRRQAEPNPRLAAENARLRDQVRDLKHHLDGADYLIRALKADQTLLSGDLEKRTTERDQAISQGNDALRRVAEMENTARRASDAMEHAVSTPPWMRTPEDEDTVSTDVRQLRDDQPHNYLNRTREAWKPSSPAVLSVTPIPPEDADGRRFAGLVRVTTGGAA